MSNTPHHIREHAKRHNDDHLYLKTLLDAPFDKENVWPVFLSTFFITIFSIVIFMNWGNIVNFFTPTTPPPLPATMGFQTGVLSTYRVQKQTYGEYGRYIASINTDGPFLTTQSSFVIGRTPVEEAEEEERQITEDKQFYGDMFKNAVWLTNELSTGQHLTRLAQSQTKVLQKSLLATYYLSEKSPTINSEVINDTKLLRQINNALAVDIFQYLNQSNDRAGSLDNYINLLDIMARKCQSRIGELNSKVNFLKANFSAKEVAVQSNEEEFFNNLHMFNGENAENSLEKFIGLQESQVEIKAKIGAYETLKGYYEFFQPKLDNLVMAIKANRNPLIAGVKVVEIQNMTLPIIIKQ